MSAMRCFDEWVRPLEQQLNEEMSPKQENDEKYTTFTFVALILAALLFPLA